MAELLKVDNVSMVFGGLRAVSNLSMHIDEGELIALSVLTAPARRQPSI